jgi:hypothetical protein
LIFWARTHLAGKLLSLVLLLWLCILGLGLFAPFDKDWRQLSIGIVTIERFDCADISGQQILFIPAGTKDLISMVVLCFMPAGTDA